MNLRQARQALNVGRGATPEIIKKAFRKKAFEVHPDRNPHDNGAEEKFKMVNMAYELLRLSACGVKGMYAPRESWAPGMDTSRIKSYYRKGLWLEPVEVSEAEVDGLFEEKEWHVLKYCACFASDPAIQQRAMDHLAAGKRYHDLLNVCRPISDGHTERARYVLSIFERDIETIIGSSSYLIEREKLKEILDFTIENTGNMAVAKKVLDGHKANGFLFRLARIKNLGVLRFIIDAMEQKKMWREIKDSALYSSSHMKINLRKLLTSLLERHLDEIIEAKQNDVLTFLWRTTQDNEIKNRIQDALAEARDYQTIRESVREFLERVARSRDRLLHDCAV